MSNEGCTITAFMNVRTTHGNYIKALVSPSTNSGKQEREEKKAIRVATAELFKFHANIKRKSNTWNILGKLNFLLRIKTALESFDIVFACMQYISYSNKINLGSDLQSTSRV